VRAIEQKSERERESGREREKEEERDKEKQGVRQNLQNHYVATSYNKSFTQL